LVYLAGLEKFGLVSPGNHFGWAWGPRLLVWIRKQRCQHFIVNDIFKIEIAIL